jgi:hypothetical protein
MKRDWPRHEHAWLLRAEGFTLHQIGIRLGIKKDMARVLVLRFGRRMQRATRKAHWRLTKGGKSESLSYTSPKSGTKTAG